jgi:hypothetical protein
MTDSHREEYRRVALRLTGELNQLLKDLRAQRDYTEKQIGEVVVELEILRLFPSANAVVARPEEYEARIIRPREEKLVELKRQLEELKSEIPIFEDVIRVARNQIVMKTEIEG